MNIIAYIIAGVSTAAFLILWFVTSYRELHHKKREVETAESQAKMHAKLHMEAKYGPNEQCAKRMMITSQMVYLEATKNYNRTLKKAIYRIPGMLMGFYEFSEKNF